MKVSPSTILTRSRPVLSRLAVPGLAFFFCAILVAIKPVAELSRTYGFLSLTINTLFFFPGSTLGAQVEQTVLGLIGCFVGLGWSALIIKIATVFNKGEQGSESARSRILGAFAVAIAACIAGYIRSHSPRLTVGSRLALFHTIFLVTNSMDRVDVPAQVVLDLLYPTVFAAGSSLIARLLFPTTSVGTFLALTQTAFRTSERLLLASVDDFFDPSPEPTMELAKLRAIFISEAAGLPSAYDSTVYELSFEKFAPYRLLPFLSVVQRLKRDLAAGSSHSSRRPTLVVPTSSETTLGSPASARTAFEQPTRDFARSMTDAFVVIHRVLEGRPDDGLAGARERLAAAEIAFRDAMDLELEQAVLRWEQEDKASKKLDKELLQVSLFAYTIREISSTLDEALASARELSVHTGTRSRVRFPRLSRKWLGENSVTAGWDESGANRKDPDNETLPDGEQLRTEIETSVAEAFLRGADPVHVRDARFGSALYFVYASRKLWDSATVVQVRIRLAQIEAGLKERRHHFHYSLKVGLGVSLLSLPAFLSPSSASREWWVDSRGQWIPISFLYVLETTAGQTWRIGFYRAIGTVSGSILGCIIWLISRGNAYGLVVLTTLYGCLTAYIMLYTSAPGVGIVASITIPPILYIPYLELAHISVVDIALKRTSDVCIGIAAAVLATEFIFPSHAKDLFLTSMASTLDELSQLYLAMSRGNLAGEEYMFESSSAERIERSVSGTLGRSHLHLTSLKVEITLIHKPIRIYRRVVNCVQKLSDLLISISVIREKIPREATVTRVLQERKDIVSSVLVHLFACSHAFRSRLPLPQYLPSPREAVHQWEVAALEGLLASDDIRRTGDLGDITLAQTAGAANPGPLHRDAAFLYAFAESQALEDVIQVIEELTELTRILFGSSTFFPDHGTDQRQPPGTPANPLAKN